jgi:PEP-CTERM motif
MKKRLWFRKNQLTAVLFLATCGVWAGTAQANNILVNGSFESGLVPWNTDSGGSLSTEFAKDGQWSFKALGHEFAEQYFAPVAVSSIEQLSYWAYHHWGILNWVDFYYADNSNGYWTAEITAANTWTKVDLTKLLKSDKSLVGFRVYGTSAEEGTYAYLDHFELITAVPEPETWAMLLAGLGLMGTIARRRKVVA